jgi:outer membrane protein assembly factor BamB
VWSFATEGAVWAGSTYDGGTVYAASDDGSVYALDAASGRERWRFSTAGAIRSRPTVAGRHLLVSSDDGFLYRLKTEDGGQHWRARLVERPAPRPAFGAEGFRYQHYASSAAVADGVVFVGSAEGHLDALEEQTGRRRWRFTTGDSVTSTPVIRDGAVYFGSFDGHVYALEADDGRLRWKYDTGAPVPSSPAWEAGRVIVGSRSYDLLALRGSDGARVWSYYYWFSWVESSPAVSGGRVYVGSSDAQLLLAIDARRGGESWRFDTGGSAWARPAVTPDAVFVGTVGVADYIVDHRATFHAVERATGRGLWQFEVARPEDAEVWGFPGSPAVGGGRVFVGATDGRVLAFDQTPSQ